MAWRIWLSIAPSETSPPWICATAARSGRLATAAASISKRSPRTTRRSRPLIARRRARSRPTPAPCRCGDRLGRVAPGSSSRNTLGGGEAVGLDLARWSRIREQGACWPANSTNSRSGSAAEWPRARAQMAVVRPADGHHLIRRGVTVMACRAPPRESPHRRRCHERGEAEHAGSSVGKCPCRAACSRGLPPLCASPA